MAESPTPPDLVDTQTLVAEAATAIEQLESFAILGCGDTVALSEAAMHAIEKITPANTSEMECQLLREQFYAAVKAVVCTAANSRTAHYELQAIRGPVPQETLAWVKEAVAAAQICNPTPERTRQLERLEQLIAQAA